MTFAQWISQVVAIGTGKGLTVTYTYPDPGLVTFTWRGAYRSGVAGAGVSMIGLTTPDEFTRLWYDAPPSVQPPTVIGPAEPPAQRGKRVGRFVPRVPAMAVSDSLQELFK
jgi:hypothetical protein